MKLSGTPMSVLNFVKNLLVNLLVIGSIVLIAIVTYKEIRRSDTVIEEISMPPKLAELGYSGQVAAMRLLDSVNTLNDEAQRLTDLNKKTQIVASSRQIELVEPQSGLSIRTISKIIGSLLPIERTYIAGEFICNDTKCSVESARLRLRIMTKDSLRIASAGPIGPVDGESDIDTYFRKSAVELLKIVDPIVIAEHMAASATLPNYNNEFGPTQGVKDESIRISKALVRRSDPNDARAAALIGQMYGLSKDYKEAERWFSKVGGLASEDEVEMRGTALSLWGEMLAEENDLVGSRSKIEEAVRYFDRAHTDGELDEPFYQWWALALEKLERFPEADTVLALWKDKAPDDPSVYYFLGERSLMVSAWDEAREYFLTTTDLDPGHVSAYQGLGEAFTRLGQRWNAFGMYAKSLELDKSNPVVRDVLTRLALTGIGKTDAQRCDFMLKHPDVVAAAMSVGSPKLRREVFDADCSSASAT